jgi:hypothetical protein
VSGAEARGITWGNAFLRYNDHDNSVTAIPTTVEGRSALYHRNTSLIFDHNAAILWCDRDPDGNVIEFGAAALVPGDERLLAAVEAVAKGEEIADAPILRRRPQDKTIDFEDFFNTGGVTSFAHYVAFDHEEIVGGQMDVSRDSDIQTNFDEIYFDTAEFVDEDVDEDDEEDLPLP